MSKPTWAKIVYGRTYHLDFRFVTVPHDFSAPEIAWASPYILATTQQARNLSDSPRWSLFKNKTHCIVGVTCMVRDLKGKSSEAMAKDEHGRPLYVFLGYATQLNQNPSQSEIPAYTETRPIGFEQLYGEIEQVWLAREYDDRNPFFSEYKPFSSGMNIAKVSLNTDRMPRLNNAAKYPQKTFVQKRASRSDRSLWLASAQCLEPTSICLNIKGKQLVNSPFLNQTISRIDKFTIRNRHITKNSDRYSQSTRPHQSPDRERQGTCAPSTLRHIISTRAKEDIDLILQQAAKVTSASQDSIDNPIGNTGDRATEQSTLQSDLSYERENFGIKTKKSDSSQDKNWF